MLAPSPGSTAQKPVRDGLGLLDEAFVPHYRSPEHPETAAIELVVALVSAPTASLTAHCATGRSC